MSTTVLVRDGAGEPGGDGTPAGERAAGTWLGGRAAPSGPALVLGAAIALWVVVFSVLVIRRHQYFGTFDYDLAIHDQSVWVLSRGEWFTTVRGLPVFGHHATFGYYLLVPFYWFGAGPDFLNVVQNLFIATGAVPLYLLARRRGLSGPVACAAGLVWLANPSLQFFAWETFHPEVLALTPLMVAYLAATRNRWWWYWGALLVALSWKEDISLAVVMLGLLALLQRRWRLGAATVALGAAWFVAFTMVLVPHLAGGGTVYGKLYGDLGQTPSEVIRTGLTDPGAIVQRLADNDALGYGWELASPFGLVPFGAPAVVAVGLPQAMVNLLSTASFTFDPRYHYQAVPVMALALGMVETLGWARRRWPAVRVGTRCGPAVMWGLLALAIVGATATTVTRGPSPIGRSYGLGYWPSEPAPGQEVIEQALARIGPDDGVAAHWSITPHVSQRRYAYTFPNPWKNLNYGIDPSARGEPDKVRWIVIETYDLKPEDRALLDELVAGGEFVVRTEDLGILVAERVREPAGFTGGSRRTR